MGVEFGSNSMEVQDREIQLARERQIEQNEAEHRRLGEILDSKSTIGNEGERKQNSPETDSGRLKEEPSKLDNKRSIEDAANKEQAEHCQNADISQKPLENQRNAEYNKGEPTDAGVRSEEINSQKDASDSMPEKDMTREKQMEPDGHYTDADCVGKAGEVLNELNNALELFEQSRWDGMSPEQQKEAVDSLRDLVADDLELQDKPDVKYYNNPDNTDFGGYSPSDNAIYINEHNMGDAKETADTIAHESRHCWQYEMVKKNPDTPESRQFAENFEDYIKPQDDYVEYRNQPVEADAREYAASITDNIPREYVKEPSEIRENTSPKVDTYKTENIGQGAVFEEVPSDVNLKEIAEVEGKVPVSDALMKSLEGSGLTPDKINEIRDLPKPDYSNGGTVERDINKPDPKTYLNPEYYQKHLEPFEKTGCYRIQRTDPMLPDDQYGGVLGHRSGLFVTSGEDMMKSLKEADGDVSKLEKIFGMNEGDWGKNPVIIRVDDPRNLRIPDGNELGAWTKYYIPGGFTSGNQAEAVIDSVPRGEYQVMKFNDPELMEWMRKGIGE